MTAVPFVPVTDREGTRDKGQPADGTAGEPQARTRRAARARTMLAALSAVTQRARCWRVAARPPKAAKRVDPYADVLTDREEAAPSVRGRSLWADGPASPAEQWDYLRAGAWAPGEQHWLVEALAKLYGALVLALTVAVAVPLWVLQRPGRTSLAGLVLALWWFATLADAPTVGGAP